MMCWLLSEGIFLLNYTWIDSEKPQMLSDKPFVLIAVMDWVIGQENMGIISDSALSDALIYLSWSQKKA